MDGSRWVGLKFIAFLVMVLSLENGPFGGPNYHVVGSSLLKPVEVHFCAVVCFLVVACVQV